MNPHADRDRSEEPRRDERVERRWPSEDVPDSVSVFMRDRGYTWDGTCSHAALVAVRDLGLADAELAEKDATIAELRAEVERLSRERDEAQEHLAYHLRDYSLNGEATGDLAVDMAAHSGRMRIARDRAEAALARVEAPTRQLERFIEEIESECDLPECACAMTEATMRDCPIHGEDQYRGVCHDHDLTDDGECALATDLRNIAKAIRGEGA